MAVDANQERVKVLVVSQRFPLINQPWMDTYLEQLSLNNIEFNVFSLNREPKNYNAKVDSLKLLDHTYSYSLESRSILGKILTKPRFFAAANTFFKLRARIELSSLSNAKLLSYILHFYAIPEVYEGITVIHSHSEALSHRFIVLAEMLSVPLVLTFHGLPPKGVPQLRAEKRSELYSYLKAVVVNTRFAKQQVVSFGCPAEKVKVLPQGLPTEDFPFNPAPAPVPGQPLRILSIGRFHRDKGQHYSLLALKRLLNDGVPVHWTFVGSGPELSKLKALAQKIGIEMQATFLEGVSSAQLLSLLQESHVFVLASIDTPGAHVETQGVVLQEAQSSGCIVVGTRTGGIPECMNHLYDGILVDQQSSRSIQKAINYIYHNPELWERIRLNARKNVEENFEASYIGKKIAQVLSSSR